MDDTLKLLGLTQEELRERVVAHLCGKLLRVDALDEDGEPCGTHSTEFARVLDARIRERIDATVTALAEKSVLPRVSEAVEKMVLTETNKWGEKKGSPLTFVEYLIQRAEAYLSEPVNHEGKPKGSDSYSWNGTQTRLAHMVHQHLHYSIETAVKDGVNRINAAIAPALAETVKIKLDEAIKSLKVNVQTK